MLKYAQFYCSLGFSPLEIRVNTKIPERGWKHHQGNIPSEDDVFARFSHHRGNLAVLTGGHRGLVVIDFDIDDPDGVAKAQIRINEICECHLPWDKAPCARTCSGGMHFWFLSSTKMGNRASIIPNVDIRADGGYVVVPPSRAYNKSGQLEEYEWVNVVDVSTPPPILTDQTIQKLSSHKENNAFTSDVTVPVNSVKGGLGEEIGNPVINQLAFEVSQAPVGCRNHTLNRNAYVCGMIAFDKNLEPDSIKPELLIAADLVGLPSSEAKRTLDSGFDAGFEGAKERSRSPAPRTATCFPYSTGSDGYDYQARYLIKGLLPADSFGVVYGPSGHFKSFLVLSLACHIATGRDWNGHRCQQCKVLYVAGEGGSGVARRIKAWENLVNGGKADNNLAVISQPVYLTDQQQLDALVETAKQFGQGEEVGLIILDTLARCFAGADENKTADMNQFIAKADELRRLTGASILVIHHSGKDSDKGARGSSALRAAADFEFAVKRTDDGHLAAWLACTKMKDDDGAKDIAYPLRVVELFKDNDGDPVSSLVALDDGYIPDETSCEQMHLTQNQMAVWQAVRSRQASGESTDRKLILDDLKKLGINTANFSRWLDALVQKGKIKGDGDCLSAV